MEMFWALLSPADIWMMSARHSQKQEKCREAFAALELDALSGCADIRPFLIYNA
jgi:hypothetical protein